MRKAIAIFINSIPTLVMIGLIPVVENDFFLAALYIVVIFIAFKIKRERTELQVFFLGMLIMIVMEYIFVSTGVETFVRNSLFNMMPIWLPLLWGYGFVAIKRSVRVLEH